MMGSDGCNEEQRQRKMKENAAIVGWVFIFINMRKVISPQEKLMRLCNSPWSLTT